MATLRNYVLTDTYLDLQKMIYLLTHRMSLRYHVPFEDLIGESHLLFVKAFDSYNPKFKTQLTSWVYSKVNWGLLSYMRREYKHLRLGALEDAPEPTCAPNHFCLELKSELSQDAQNIVNLILDSKSEFALLCRWRKTRTRSALLKTLREHLEDRGWSAKRITRRLGEITQALQANQTEIDPRSFWTIE